jgi:outer membrane receptor protein involved in Fe transport
MEMSRLGRTAALLLSTALGFATQGPVFAQDPDQAADEEITVTGTRIARRDYSAQTPIVTVDSDAFTDRSNVAIEATLNQLPQFNVEGSQSMLSSAQTPFPAATVAPGAATLNLRGLGPNRSLVLVDGRRVQPVNGALVVDVNTIPSAAIARVEVITGGAAMVYGADAIAGVVNFILKRDYEGMDFRARYGVTEEGDGEEISLNALFGANFSDGRGNVTFGADYYRRETILSADRDWIVAGWKDPGTMAAGLGGSALSQYVLPGAIPTPAGPLCSLPSQNYPTAGFLPCGAASYYIDQNGNLFDVAAPNDPTNPYTGPVGGNSGFKINPDGSLGFIDTEGRLQLPMDRYAVFGTGRYDLTDNVEAFTDVRFSETYLEAPGFTSGVFNVWSPTVPYNPLYDDPNSPTFGLAPLGVAQHPVPAALATILNSRPTDPAAPWTYAGGLDYLPNFTTETTSNVYQVIGGLRGDATVGSRDWDWEVYVSHGKTTVNARQPEGFPYLPRIQNLFNADQYGTNFDLSSLPNFFPLSVTGHCTSGLPIFNPDGSVDPTLSVSQDCADYVVLRMNNITSLTQEIAEATVSGPFAELWAGEWLFAAGVDYRQEDFAFDPDSGFNANQDYPNVIQNIILPVSVSGTTDVSEIYLELAIPLLSDKKFVQSFEIDPGYRRSDYNTVGVIDTQKLLFDWTVNDRLRFRGGRQVANRAPNVAELFTPRGGSQLDFNAQDACGYWPLGTQSWGNRPENPNRLNLQTLCQELMVRDGAPPTFYVPGTPSANNYAFNVFGGTGNFPFSIAVTGGNPNLDSEEADTFTFGMVLGFDRVTLAVDWYDIELERAIAVPGFASIYQQCMDPQYNPLIASAPGTYTGPQLTAGNPQCALINREWVVPNGMYGAARTIDGIFVNQGGVNSAGTDVQLDWGFDVADGALNLSVVASFLDEYSEAPFAGAAFVDYTGTTYNSSFDYRTFTTIRYDAPSWTLGLRWQKWPGLDPQPGATASLPVESTDQLDLFSRWSFGERYELSAGIDNLTNQDPPVVGATLGNNALGSTSEDYDTFGRRVFVGFSVAL